MSEEHHCEWRERAERLESELVTAQTTISEQTEALAKQSEEIAAVRATVEKLQRHVFGKRSEKMPRVAEELRDPAGAEAARAAALEAREENAALRKHCDQSGINPSLWRYLSSRPPSTGR